MRRRHTPIRLSDHFDYKRLFLFVLPSIGMMIFTSIYGVVDGLFVSHFAGKSAFTAINLIMPFPMLLGAFGFMIGTGGSAVVAITLGEQKKELANRYFSFFIAVTIIGGVILSALGILFLEPVAVFFGAEGETLTHCLSYGRILFLFLTAFMLQNTFQSFLVTAEKPMLGLIVTVAAGVVNMVLDLLFVGIFQWGVMGAAIATGISQTVGGLIPLLYFLRKNNSLLRLARPRFFGRVLANACVNGSSELMTNVSLSLVNMLFNYQLMNAIGEDGVAAYGVIMYVSFIFIAVFIGYSFGSAPIVG